MEPSLAKVVPRELDLPALCQGASEASPIPMLAVAGSGNIIGYVNPAFCRLAKQLKEDLIGKGFADEIRPGPDCMGLLDRVSRTALAETHTGDEFAENPFCWSYAMWPALAADGEMLGIMIQVTESTAIHEQKTAINQALLISGLQQNELADTALELNSRLRAEIAERKRTEEELSRINADLQRFTYAASHDLQEPLRTITIYTQLLARRLGLSLDVEAQRLLNFILNGSGRMSALIKDLLAYTQLGVEERQGAALIDCAKAVEAALNNLEGSMLETQAVVTVDPLPLLSANLSQLIQLFQNLIGNALKYRKPDVSPEIRISADYLKGQWTISVRDNGIGFNPRYAEQIFGVFNRLHSTQYPGTGIGLAICKRIVELHGGHIWATAEEDRGATFAFTLPDAAVDTTN